MRYRRHIVYTWAPAVETRPRGLGFSTLGALEYVSCVRFLGVNTVTRAVKPLHGTSVTISETET